MELDRDVSEFIECCTAREVRSRRLILALDDFGFGSLGLSLSAGLADRP